MFDKNKSLGTPQKPVETRGLTHRLARDMALTRGKKACSDGRGTGSKSRFSKYLEMGGELMQGYVGQK